MGAAPIRASLRRAERTRRPLVSLPLVSAPTAAEEYGGQRLGDRGGFGFELGFPNGFAAERDVLSSSNVELHLPRVAPPPATAICLR